MATMYAIPALTTWNTSGGGGWSNTSGGVSNGFFPTTTTDVIFDANSGPARTILIADGAASGGPFFNTLTTTGSAGMTFTQSSGQLHCTGSVTLDSTVSVQALWCAGNVNLTGLGSMGSLTLEGTSNLTAPGVPISSLAVNTSGGTITCMSDISVTGLIQSNSNTFNANNFNVTAGSFGVATGTVTMGSGTWTIMGSGSPWTVAAGTTIVPGTSTIKLTYSGASAVTFAGLGKTYNNFWNATSGAAVVTNTGNNTFNNFRIDAGRTQKFTAASVTTVASFTADGTGAQIAIDSSTTSAMTLTKSGGGSVYCDNISIAHCTGLPVSTWNARSSVNGDGNTNWTFIPGNNKFLLFC